MTIQKRAKITVNLDRFGYEKSKCFIGTEDKVYTEAIDWMQMVALQFIEENDIEDEFEQNLIIDSATHSIEWESYEPYQMFAVIEDCDVEPVYGIYATRADAEEAIFTEAENWVYEIMMIDDPKDVIGMDEWDWPSDYWWMMHDACESLKIQEVPVFYKEEE